MEDAARGAAEILGEEFPHDEHLFFQVNELSHRISHVPPPLNDT
jgi:hypothetical protein